MLPLCFSLLNRFTAASEFLFVGEGGEGADITSSSQQHVTKMDFYKIDFNRFYKIKAQQEMIKPAEIYKIYFYYSKILQVQTKPCSGATDRT